MAQSFEVVYTDDNDGTTTAAVNGAPGQTIFLPPGWIAISWTDYGNPQNPINKGPLYYHNQASADQGQAKGQYP